MMTPGMGHNGGPDINGRKVSIRTAWAKALFADPETPTYVMAMAWAIHWYSKADGAGAILSNEQFGLICGISEPTATRGKKWLREHGYVSLQGGKGDQKTQFQMVVPEPVRVIPQITQGHQELGSQTLGSHRDDTPHPTDDPGVIPRLVCIQERDSGSIQDKPPARPRTAKPAISPWLKALNPAACEGVEYVDGQLRLINGARQKWLDRFGGNGERLDLAVEEIAPWVQPNSPKPILMQIEGKLAKIVGEKIDKDARYDKGAKPAKGISRLKEKFLKASQVVGGVK